MCELVILLATILASHVIGEMEIRTWDSNPRLDLTRWVTLLVIGVCMTCWGKLMVEGER